MNSVSVAKNWFSSLFTSNLIRLMLKQYLQFRHDRWWGEQAMRGEGTLFFSTQICLQIFHLSVCLFVRVSWNTGFNFMFRFKSSFGCICLRTPNIELFSHRKWVQCILRNLVYFEFIIFLWPYLTLIFIDMNENKPNIINYWWISTGFCLITLPS